MSIIRITAHIYVDTGTRDPEQVASRMNDGLESSVAHFPDGEVLLAEVDSAREATAEEISEKRLEEE